MKRILFSSFLILFSVPALVFAQRDSIRALYLDAESWFLFEEYKEALPLYESLLEGDPGNDNLKYKIGICLLNDPYQKDKAIQYLLEASQNINPAYKQNSFKERTAPPDALYHLGDAYLVNELLNRAIESYEEFLEVMDRNVYDAEIVQAQIQSCKNAQRLLTMPVDIDLFLLDSLINTRYADIRPVISGDGSKMVFVTELPFYDAAFYTEKREDGWSYPQNLTQLLGFDEDIYPVALSRDGSELILYYDDDYIGNLYYSRMEDGRWLPATKMGENISTKYWESHASFSNDGKLLYFTSNRKGGYGGLDIYLSERQADGKWGVPVNLGPAINTPYNEECPYISEDGQTLYFSSYGHYNMGGYDIFYSRKKEDGSWAEPVNIGYPINTTDDDLYFQPIDNGKSAYFSVYSPRGIGRHDIYFMNVYSVDNPRYYSLTGKLRTKDGSLDTTRTAIYVIDSESRDTLIYTSPAKDGSFAFELKQGIYELHFKGEGYEELIRPLEINSNSEKRGIALGDDIELALLQEEADLTPEKALVFEGEESKLKLKEAQYEGVVDRPLSIPLTAPRGSTVIVRTYRDSILISTDTLVTDRRRTELQLKALPGSSEIELEMIDKDGSIHRNRLRVKGISPVDKETVIRPQTPEAQETLVPPVQETGEALQDIPREGELRALISQLQQGALEPDEVSAAQLKQYLLENSSGPLFSYLDQLDLEEEGILNAQELLDHLERLARTEEFSMEEVRAVMLESLVTPPEPLEPGQEDPAGGDGPESTFNWPLLLVLLLAGAGIFWFIILWWKRRKRKEKEEY